MILNNLKLTNFRKFRDELIEFPRGIIGIIGRNGSGKSTILEAVGWVLYGNVVARSAKEEIKSQNATEDDACKVEMEFILGDHNYKIARELKGKASLSQAFIYIDGAEKPAVARDTEVTRYVEGLLRMDYNTFMLSVYARQKDLGSLSALVKGDRQKAIRKMLNIDVIDKAVVAIRTDARDKGKYIEGLEHKLVDVDGLKKERVKTAEDISKKKAIIETKEIEKDKLKKEKDALHKQREEQEALYKRFNDLSSLATKMSSKLEESKKRFTEIIKDKEQLEKASKELIILEPKEAMYEKTKKQKEDMDSLRTKYERKVAIEKDVKDLQDETEKRIKRLDGAKKKLALFMDLDVEQKDLKEEVAKLRDRVKTARGKQEEAGQELSAYASKIKELTEQKKNIRSLGPGSECPTCLRKLGDSYDETIKHFDEEMAKFREKYEKLIEVKQKLDKETEVLTVAEEKLEEKKEAHAARMNSRAVYTTQLKGEQEELGKVKIKLEKAQASLSGLSGISFDESEYKKTKALFEALSKDRDEIISLRKEVSRLPGVIADVDNKKKIIAALDDDTKKNGDQIKKLGFDEKEYKGIKNSYDQISEKYSECLTDLKDKEGDLKVKNANLKALDDKVKEQGQYAADIKDIKDDIQYLTRLDTMMKDFRDELINRIRPLLIARASYLFKELTDDRYPLLDLDEDYNILVVDGKDKFEIKRFSGGEEDLANLCLRIAISQVIAERSGAEINFMALDEIFGSQDDNRRSNILNSFNKLVNQFAQIFLITHIITIREKLPHVLRVEEDDNLESHAEFD